MSVPSSLAQLLEVGVVVRRDVEYETPVEEREHRFDVARVNGPKAEHGDDHARPDEERQATKPLQEGAGLRPDADVGRRDDEDGQEHRVGGEDDRGDRQGPSWPGKRQDQRAPLRRERHAHQEGGSTSSRSRGVVGAVSDPQAADALRVLLSQSPGAGASEGLLLEVAAHSATTFARLRDAEMKLAARLVELVAGDPRAALAVARTLKETVKIGTAVSSRAREMLAAASAMRLQREHFERSRSNDV